MKELPQPPTVYDPLASFALEAGRVKDLIEKLHESIAQMVLHIEVIRDAIRGKRQSLGAVDLIKQAVDIKMQGERMIEEADRMRCEDELRQKRSATCGCSLTMVPVPDWAGFTVGIDGGPEFYLPDALGQLLAVLATDTGHSTDDLVGWKTQEEVQAQLWIRTKRTFSRHAVQNLVCRLRKALQASGHNKYLVQTDGKDGCLRFAQRRKGHSGTVISP